MFQIDYLHLLLYQSKTQNIEFIFAPPAIAFAIGAYLNIFFPAIPVLVIAILAYFVFTGINIYGVEAAASFELVVTIIALIGLLIFEVTFFNALISKFICKPQ